MADNVLTIKYNDSTKYTLISMLGTTQNWFRLKQI